MLPKWQHKTRCTNTQSFNSLEFIFCFSLFFLIFLLFLFNLNFYAKNSNREHKVSIRFSAQYWIPIYMNWESKLVLLAGWLTGRSVCCVKWLGWTKQKKNIMNSFAYSWWWRCCCCCCCCFIWCCCIVLFCFGLLLSCVVCLFIYFVYCFVSYSHSTFWLADWLFFCKALIVKFTLSLPYLTCSVTHTYHMVVTHHMQLGTRNWQRIIKPLLNMLLSLVFRTFIRKQKRFVYKIFASPAVLWILFLTTTDIQSKD